MSTRISRRRFLQSTAAGALAVATHASASPSTRPLTPWRGALKSQLNVGIVGVGRRGFEHVQKLATMPNVNVIAMADVDSAFLASAAKVLPDAARFEDFREMIDLPALDAVLVSTPDHTHAVASAAAMRAGKHVYCEKPLSHTVYESRVITELARKHKLVTQLGTQMHAQDNYRRVVELIRAGAIGTVRHVHVFCDKSYAGTQPHAVPPPATLNYDLWLGPIPFRQYDPSFHPRYWRRWWAFGNGTLGDMGCHYMDLPFWALGLKYPDRISAESAPTHPEGLPAWTIVHYDFPAGKTRPAVKLSWYDCGKVPEDYAKWNIKERDGIMFVGDEGMLFADYTQRRLYPQDKFRNYKPPRRKIATSIGHHEEWVNACLKNNPSLALDNFDYSGPLSETVLLGNVAVRAGKPLDWDPVKCKIPNAPDAERFLHCAYRSGWVL